ncbi:hypothetical protein NEOC84_001223|uniref:hypothetical protein n=1 Tax=Neochlamydia sp. AcF84 TaxID=2315858 RepID=UPI0014074969|nr:hypothetical protein [Neochlamydia sp. AcF84]NGY95308.1 hypothetical protein [Neochlamydia sp. AcF84]
MEPPSNYLPSISLTEWIPYTQAYLKGEKKGKRQYVYLNANETHIAISITKETAKDFSYRKATLPKIISITTDKIKEYEEQYKEKEKNLQKGALLRKC